MIPNKKVGSIKQRFNLIIIISVMFWFNSNAQISNIISSVNISDAREQNPINITAQLYTADNVSTLYVVYKAFGTTEFKKIEMYLTGLTATAQIPADVVLPPSLEYYIQIIMRSGPMENYPVGVDQGVPPIQIAVSSFSEKDKEMLILSPSPDEIVSKEELFISVSFIKAPDSVDPSKTKILINNKDVSPYAVFNGDILILSGENISELIEEGPCNMQIGVYDSSGTLNHTLSRSFKILSTEEIEMGGMWTYRGILRGESRNEQFDSESTWYNNVSGDFSAGNDIWNLNGKVYITSEEKEGFQPFNRYLLSITGGDWLKLQVGDAFPQFPNVILDGKRVRGVSGELNLGFLNIQTTYGETERSIEGALLETYSAEEAPLESNVIQINEQKYGAPYGRVELGTYKRKLFAIRPSFGSGENFQWGFNYLHGKDETSSIEFGARPKENLVLGTDLIIAIDNRNILFTTQAAVSVINNDISSGSLSDTQIDEIFGENNNFNVSSDDVKKIRDIIGNFITVNQYLGPWNPQEFASLAADASLALNYFSNSVNVSYIYRGNDYQSFGQTYLKTDVSGFNFVDRIRLMDNKLFLSLGYESLKDNLQKTKIATTTFNTYSVSVSYFPRINFPNITIGFYRNDNDNGISISDPDKKEYVVDNNTNRISAQLSYDFFAGIKHYSLLSISTSTKDDNSLGNYDASFTTASLNVASEWTKQFTSNFGVIANTSEIFGIAYDYFTLSFGAKYKMLENKLILSANLSPSFGDFERQAFEFITDYNVLANLNLAFQARIFRIPDQSTNSIIGLTTRLTF